MTEKTFLARVLLTGSGIPEEDLGEKIITTVDLIENGRAVGFFATLKHEAQIVSGSVAEITPPDWEATGVTPIVRVNRSLGS